MFPPNRQRLSSGNEANAASFLLAATQLFLMKARDENEAGKETWLISCIAIERLMFITEIIIPQTISDEIGLDRMRSDETLLRIFCPA